MKSMEEKRQIQKVQQNKKLPFFKILSGSGKNIKLAIKQSIFITITDYQQYIIETWKKYDHGNKILKRNGDG